MIDHAFMQCPGIGRVRLKMLNDAGICRWSDAIARPDDIQFSWRDKIVEECHRCEQALADSDIAYFVDRFASTDKWLILSHFFDQTSFFDIETTGLEYDAPISVIVCWHQGTLHTFVEHENLDDFLELLDDVKLLTSFNGSSFDVPRVLDAFHIPNLPCPHLDLRWLSYHHGHRGGLKQIAHEMGIARPTDLSVADGELAIQLWNQWQGQADRAARDLLVRYCGSDVLLTLMLAHQLVERPVPEELWSHIQAAPQIVDEPLAEIHPILADRFGTGSPTRLRGWRRVS